MNINEQLNHGSKQYGASSKTDYFKFEKGDNRLRILTAGEVLATHFFGKGMKAATCYGEDKGCPFHGENAPKNAKGEPAKPSIKYTCYVVNVNDPDQTVLLADLPYSVTKAIGEYQTNIDYAFDIFPMPYDVTVKFDPDSTSPANMYKVIASPKRTDISEEVKNELAKAMSNLTPKMNVDRKKSYQIREHEKSGLLVEKKKETQQEWATRMNKEKEADIASGKIKAIEPVIQYPEDQINPEDIPF